MLQYNLTKFNVLMALKFVAVATKNAKNIYTKKEGF